MVAAITSDEPRVTSERGRWYVRVPWDQADNLYEWLKGRGLRSTVCLDPEARRARLELWPGVSPEDVVAALDAGPAKKRWVGGR